MRPKMNKLVRDFIPEIIKKKGEEPVYYQIVDPEEMKQRLVDKLYEEIDEFKKDESIGELADIFEVLYAICDFKGYSKDTVEKQRIEKSLKNGGFNKRIVLTNVKKTKG
jgi:predicted house-cleaning noncanonical NTP pyrophosphatase (MazG superfamily)